MRAYKNRNRPYINCFGVSFMPFVSASLYEMEGQEKTAVAFCTENRGRFPLRVTPALRL
jgi:hypothetical protein